MTKIILENKGTPDIVEKVISDNKSTIFESIKSLSSFSLLIDETIGTRSLKCRVTINFKSGSRYKGNINYKECLDSKFKNCIININLSNPHDPVNVIKTLTHELTHLYELYQIDDKFVKTKWKWQESLDDMNTYFSNSHLLYFRDILYLSLPQELNARVSSIYFYLSMNVGDGSTKDHITKILENSIEWKNYLNLLSFDPKKLTNGIINYYSSDINFAFFIINKLNEEIGVKGHISNDVELGVYFNRMKKSFNLSAKKYKAKLLKVVDRVYTEKNKTLEYLTRDLENVDYDEYVKSERRVENLNIIVDWIDFINHHSDKK
jgi:hypothetical protein